MTIEDQPPPIPQPERIPTWNLVIADVERQLEDLDGVQREVTLLAIDDMRQRDAKGRATYGVPLTSHNGRDHLVDCYQELLDAIAYMRAALDEKPSEPLGRVYSVTLGLALSVRFMIYQRR